MAHLKLMILTLVSVFSYSSMAKPASGAHGVYDLYEECMRSFKNQQSCEMLYQNTRAEMGQLVLLNIALGKSVKDIDPNRFTYLGFHGPDVQNSGVAKSLPPYASKNPRFSLDNVSFKINLLQRSSSTKPSEFSSLQLVTQNTASLSNLQMLLRSGKVFQLRDKDLVPLTDGAVRVIANSWFKGTKKDCITMFGMTEDMEGFVTIRKDMSQKHGFIKDRRPSLDSKECYQLHSQFDYQ